MSDTAIPTSFNLAAYVLARAPHVADKIALSVLHPDTQEDWTYARLESAIRGAATGLLSRGLVQGDRVVLRLGNTAHFPIAFLACITAGLIPVPTSAQLTQTEFTNLLADVAPKAVISDTAVDAAFPLITPKTLETFYDAPPADYAMGDPNHPAYIIFTSGTSGKPRGVVHAHRAIWARRMMMDGWYAMTPEDRILHAGAFNWTYTLGTGLMDPWTMGATALIPADRTRAQDLPALLARHNATLFAAAPGVYRQALRGGIPPLPHLRHSLSAGEKLPDVTRDHWQDATHTPIYEAYGMSECSTFISGNPTIAPEVGTLGHPQPGRRVALLSAGGTPAEHGQIAIHKDDAGLMLGYLDAPDETADRFVGDWFLTGDMATRTPTGAIRYEGRVDDMMNAGGYRVSPIEVEHALTQHPAIAEAAAVELRVKSDASVIAAFYVATDVILDAELTALCETHLARYKTPRLFIRTDALPRGANNKLLRRMLRDTWEAEHGQT